MSIERILKDMRTRFPAGTILRAETRELARAIKLEFDFERGTTRLLQLTVDSLLELGKIQNERLAELIKAFDAVLADYKSCDSGDWNDRDFEAFPVIIEARKVLAKYIQCDSANKESPTSPPAESAP